MTGTATDDHRDQPALVLVPGREQPVPADGRPVASGVQHVQRSRRTWSARRTRPGPTPSRCRTRAPGEAAPPPSTRRAGRPAQRRARLAGQHDGCRADRGDHGAGRRMTPPFTVPAVVVAPGRQADLLRHRRGRRPACRTSTISLRNSTTRENLGADGTWGVNVTAGLLPDLADRHQRADLQLDVHDAVQPDAGHVQLLGRGQRQPGPDQQPRVADHQRPGAG